MASRPAPRSAWKPGQSGNPGGRPKELKDLQNLARMAYPEALALAVNLIRGEYSTLVEEERTVGRGQGKEVIRTTRRKPVAVPPEVALKAVEFIAERALGKPVQPISGVDDDGAPNGPVGIQRIERVILQVEDNRNGMSDLRVIEYDPKEPLRR